MAPFPAGSHSTEKVDPTLERFVRFPCVDRHLLPNLKKREKRDIFLNRVCIGHWSSRERESQGFLLY